MFRIFQHVTDWSGNWSNKSWQWNDESWDNSHQESWGVREVQPPQVRVPGEWRRPNRQNFDNKKKFQIHIHDLPMIVKLSLHRGTGIGNQISPVVSNMKVTLIELHGTMLSNNS